MQKRWFPESILVLLRRIRAECLSLGLARSGPLTQSDEEIEASREFSIVVAISDAPEMTARCLESLAAYAPHSEIILVDDASILPETADLLRGAEQIRDWTFIRHEQSLGHSRSCEAGSNLARRPYLCLLNSDTVVTPWSWRAALEAFEAEPRIAVTGPSTSWAATSQMIERACHCRHYWSDRQIFSFAQQYVSSRPPKSWVDLPIVSGFAFFIRRNIWNEFAGFDKKLSDYGNESELCERLTRAGWRITWTQNSYIHHFGEQSYGQMGRSEVRRRRLASKAYIDDKFASQ